jgi:hypothetical protein
MSRRIGEQEADREFAGAELGDERLSRRLKQIARRVLESPGASFPRQSGGVAELEATYRFLGNERVLPAGVLGPHFEATVERMARSARVLVAHDTTEARYQGEREELGHLAGGGNGFMAHVALAVAEGEAREPLGVLHLETIVRRGPPKRTTKRCIGPDSESLRWQRGVTAARKRAGDAAELVHLMDREGDAYALFAMMLEQGDQFVVRGCYDRRLLEGKVSELFTGAPLMAQRNVPLTRREKKTNRNDYKRHPPRHQRVAQVEIRARALSMRRPCDLREGPDSLALHLVYVLETGAPEGEPPLSWWLWTSLPISTEVEVLAVVDAYRARWVIEEYFKALKTGCALEERQLESARSLQNALALFMPIAWLLLRMRSISRARPDSPGETLLSPSQLSLLRGLYRDRCRRDLPQSPTAHQTTLALAALGGHIPNNGPPGWIVLGRGLDRLLNVESGLRAVAEM